jgi:hypothetical protein
VKSKKKGKTKVMKSVWTVGIKPGTSLADELKEKAEIVLSINDLFLILTAVVAPLVKEVSSLRQEVERISNAEYVWEQIKQVKKRRGE